MSSDDLSIRFSNELYATRSEVSKTLGTSLIDTIWANILKYRSQFTRVLSLNSIDSSPYFIVLTPFLNEELTKLNRKINKILAKVQRLNNQEILTLARPLYTQQLYWVGRKYNLDFNETFIHNLINDNLSTLPPDKLILLRYFNSLKYIQKNFLNPIDLDYVVNLFITLTGNEGLTDIWRQTEIAVYEQKTLIGKTYSAAPVHKIDDLMSNLFDFLTRSDHSPIIKAVITFYFVNYVKPFETHSEEMAILLAKTILSKDDLDWFGLWPVFESLLVEDQENLFKILLEVQKSGDITYLLVYLLINLNNSSNLLLNQITEFEKNALQNENLRPVQSHIITEPLIEEKAKEMMITEQVNEEENKMGEQPLPSLPLEDSQKVSSFELSKPIVEEKQNLNIKALITPNMALPPLSGLLSDEEAKIIENHLMETNPSLKRNQAYFYARHCTIGKYYTIDQFKKVLSCAYETARTSMDHLAELGYYRKEQFKNKFLYTPNPEK